MHKSLKLSKYEFSRIDTNTVNTIIVETRFYL